MNQGLLTGEEFNKYISEIYLDEQKKYVTERLLKLTKDEQQFVVEMLKNIFPNDAKLINESKWYNTVGDIVGIFDPTGVVDLINGISYWKQGDHLFALLSWISVIPYVGDVVAKPVIGVFKAGGIIGKEFKAAMVAGDAAKIASTAKQSGPLKIFVERAPIWGGKLIKMLSGFINKFPIVRRIIPLIENYVKLFKSASVEMKTASKAGKEAEAVFKGFREFGGVKNNWLKYMKSNAPLWEKLNAGSFRLFGGNPATRSLMRRSKWYLGFLDAVGLANTVGPEEVESKVPDFEAKLDEYNRSPQAQRNMEQDVASSKVEAVPPPPTSTSTSSSIPTDPFTLLGSLFGGSSSGLGKVLS
jgi:hypothetical protein